ncbi:hypothetical protein KSX_67740 [Ktedonospora formicarum]|uniref:Uncharacterized protein n=1 Tax=Ktedonospora formicarum TaxID=2778364 RepID=A0A8J3MW58_9CHLR|nr:hypothetical protein KSX_67740 [Ktedonospora formicarum]
MTMYDTQQAVYLFNNFHDGCIVGLQGKMLAFIDYDNRMMAKPFKWIYLGKALAV